MADTVSILRDVKQAIRQPYAWPGGYPKYILMADGEALSVEGAREEWRQICEAMIRRQGLRDCWEVAGVDINWEDTTLRCVHTNKPIESAYGEDEPA